MTPIASGALLIAGRCQDSMPKYRKVALNSWYLVQFDFISQQHCLLRFVESKKRDKREFEKSFIRIAAELLCEYIRHR